MIIEVNIRKGYVFCPKCKSIIKLPEFLLLSKETAERIREIEKAYQEKDTEKLKALLNEIIEEGYYRRLKVAIQICPICGSELED